MSISTLYPSTKPTLMLDFVNNKRLDPRITFTRSTIGTYYDGKTTTMADQNLFTNSQSIASWGVLEGSPVVTANSVAAPDGTTTAGTLAAPAGAQSAVALCIFGSQPAYNTYTASVYAKAGTTNWLRIRSNVIPAGSQSFFDLQNGVAYTGAYQAATITAAGNGWYRCSVTYTITTAGTNRTDFGPTAANGSNATAGNESVYLWGAQLETRGAPTVLVPTTTAAITTFIPVLQTAAANVPRFNHDPITGLCKGLLLETNTINRKLYSSTFSDASYTLAAATITAAAAVAPDGTLTATLLKEDTTTAVHKITGLQTYSGAASQAYGFSFFAKMAGRRYIVFDADGSAGRAVFDLQTGVITATNYNYYWMIPVGNGWYRCAITKACSGDALSQIISMSSDGTYTSGQANAYAGNGYSGVLIWGLQVEPGGYTFSSYIPTTSAEVVRDLDVPIFTGTNYTSIFSNLEGSISMTFDSVGILSRYPVLTATGVAGENMYLAAYNGTTIEMYSTTSYVVSSTTTAVNYYSNAPLKIAYAYRLQDMAVIATGSTIGTSTIPKMPALTSYKLGGANVSGYGTNMHIQKFEYYSTRLSNADLAKLVLAAV
jgi:hypothetical protein